MTRPILITDCDEVLLHMVRHFSGWLEEEHDVLFRPEEGNMAGALRHRADGATLPSERVWELLWGFFETEMPGPETVNDPSVPPTRLAQSRANGTEKLAGAPNRACG